MTVARPLPRPSRRRAEKPPCPGRQARAGEGRARAGRRPDVRHRRQCGRRPVARHDHRQARSLSLPARPTARASKPSTRRATTSRSGSATARRRARQGRDRLSCAGRQPSASIRPTIRRRISKRRRRRRAGRGRAQAHRLGAHLCAPRRRSAASTSAASPPTSTSSWSRPEPADVLAKLADAGDVAAALDSYNPPQAGIQGAQGKARRAAQGRPSRAKPKRTSRPAACTSPKARILRPGMKDPRVVALRKRLNIAGDKNNPLYDDAVRDAVRRSRPKPTSTSTAMSAPTPCARSTARSRGGARPSADPIDTIIVNMERWRWLPRDLGNPHVIVNMPDYTLTLYNNGKVVWKTKIVVGKPGKATPLISAEMKFITVNPTWNVPPSIIENEYLPALQQDPQALDRIGLKVEQDRRRHHPHLAAAGRRQRARPHPLQLPQQVPGVSARHAGQISVRPGQARLQPRLHARAESADLRREAAVAGRLPQEHYTAERLREDVRRQRDQHQLPEATSRST